MTNLEWLYENAGPVIRWRLISDFGYAISAKQKDELRSVYINTPEIQRWLRFLGSRRIHGSKNTHAENAMGKLYEFGMRQGYETFDQKMHKYADALKDSDPDWIQPEVSFLIATGFSKIQIVETIFKNRLNRLVETANRGVYDFHLTPEEAKEVPRAWQGKLIYRPEHCGPNIAFPLPSIYDLIALATWPTREPATEKKIAAVLAFICNQRFQDIPGGYAWNRINNRCYAAGRGYLAILNPVRKILFLELAAKFTAAHRSPWFQREIEELEKCKNSSGRYVFPTSFLTEKESYYTYQGAHMGLAENRRQQTWREIESTFRMENIKRLISTNSDKTTTAKRGKR